MLSQAKSRLLNEALFGLIAPLKVTFAIAERSPASELQILGGLQNTLEVHGQSTWTFAPRPPSVTRAAARDRVSVCERCKRRLERKWNGQQKQHRSPSKEMALW